MIRYRFKRATLEGRRLCSLLYVNELTGEIEVKHAKYAKTEYKKEKKAFDRGWEAFKKVLSFVMKSGMVCEVAETDEYLILTGT